MEICHKILTPRPAFQRHSRSLEVGTDTDRSATYDFLLVFHSNYGPISTVSEINGAFAKCSHPLYLTPPLRGFSWNFVTVVGLERKLEGYPYQSVKKCDDTSIRFDTVSALDRQTDRQTDGRNW